MLSTWRDLGSPWKHTFVQHPWRHFQKDLTEARRPTLNVDNTVLSSGLGSWTEHKAECEFEHWHSCLCFLTKDECDQLPCAPAPLLPHCDELHRPTVSTTALLSWDAVYSAARGRKVSNRVHKWVKACRSAVATTVWNAKKINGFYVTKH